MLIKHEVVLAAHQDERWGQVPSWTAADLIPIVYNKYMDPG